MWTYSGLVPSDWRKGTGGNPSRKAYKEWSQQWSQTAPFPPAPGFNFTPLDDAAAELGIAENMYESNPNCASNEAQRNQIWRPSNVGNYQFAII